MNEKIDIIELERTITDVYHKLYELNKELSKLKKDIEDINEELELIILKMN